MRHTITVDIINEKAIKLLQDLESLQLIRLHTEDESDLERKQRVKDYKGAFSPQSVHEINEQLKSLRKGA